MNIAEIETLSPKPLFAKVAECLYRHQSSDTYYGLVKRAGKQFRQSLKTTDRKLADRRLTEFRAKVGRLSDTKGTSKILFEELAQRWFDTTKRNLKPASARRRETSIEQLKNFFGKMPVRSITPQVCDEWIIKRGEKISASTFNNDRGTLKMIFEYAIRDGLLLDNPARNIPRRKMSRAKATIPTREQFRLLVETIRAGYSSAQAGGDLVELLAYSGMRLAEATSICWKDIDFERNYFTVTGGETGTKNLEARTVPLFPAMRKLLEKIRGKISPEPNECIIHIETAKKAMINACTKAKLPHFMHHSLRHYFVSNAIEAGIDFKVIANWIGHKDGGILVAQTYGHLRDTHSFEMAKRMVFDGLDAEAS